MPPPKFTEEDYKEAERQMGLSNKKKKREQKERDPNRKPVRSLHHIDDEEWLARHAQPEEENEPEEEAEAGETTEAHLHDGKPNPAPIKNDDKTSYKQKAAERDAKNSKNWNNK